MFPVLPGCSNEFVSSVSASQHSLNTPRLFFSISWFLGPIFPAEDFLVSPRQNQDAKPGLPPMVCCTGASGVKSWAMAESRVRRDRLCCKRWKMQNDSNLSTCFCTRTRWRSGGDALRSRSARAMDLRHFTLFSYCSILCIDMIYHIIISLHIIIHIVFICLHIVHG